MGNILITGATGLLGSSLYPHLNKCGYEVKTHARANHADFMFDLSNRVESYEMLTQLQPSVIINLCSLSNVDLCENHVDLAYLANTRTVENLAHWIRIAVTPHIDDVPCLFFDPL